MQVTDRLTMLDTYRLSSYSTVLLTCLLKPILLQLLTLFSKYSPPHRRETDIGLELNRKRAVMQHRQTVKEQEGEDRVVQATSGQGGKEQTEG